MSSPQGHKFGAAWEYDKINVKETHAAEETLNWPFALLKNVCISIVSMLSCRCWHLAQSITVEFKLLAWLYIAQTSVFNAVSKLPSLIVLSYSADTFGRKKTKVFA